MKTALRWFEKASEHGEVTAMSMLCFMHYKGDVDATKDFLSAAKWCRKAADAGDAKAQYNLGVMVAHGQGLEQDFVASYQATPSCPFLSLFVSNIIHPVLCGCPAVAHLGDAPASGGVLGGKEFPRHQDDPRGGRPGASCRRRVAHHTPHDEAWHLCGSPQGMEEAQRKRGGGWRRGR